MARGAPVTSKGGSVQVTSRGHIELDLQAIAKVLGPAAVGHVLERVDEGKDTKDKPFAPYSRGYARWLERGGEDTRVDMRVTGGLMNSLAVREEVIDAKGLTLTVGPGTGTSEVRAPKTTVAPRGKNKGVPIRRMTKTGKRGPPHNLVGKYLDVKRPWLGISPRGMKLLTAIIERAKVFKGGV